MANIEIWNILDFREAVSKDRRKSERLINVSDVSSINLLLTSSSFGS
jgi:hypothetical protein